MTVSQEKVLVVEDEEALLDAVKRKLELSGISIVSASSVDEALAALQNIEGISAIWLDHYLVGKGSGLELVTIIKKEESRWKHVPIFVVSNTTTPEKVESYLRLGVDKYYTKAEVRLDKIVDELKEYLETHPNPKKVLSAE